MGHNIVVLPDLYSINETHKYVAANVPGAIIFGDPKNIEVAMSSKPLVTTTKFDSRGSAGPVYQYDFHGYMDVQVARPDSFVVAFNGAKVSTPYLVTVDGAKTGVAGKIDDSDNTYSHTGDALSCVAYCDNTGATIVMHTNTLATASTLAEAITAGGTIVEQGATLTLTADTYFRAYHPNLTASTQITFDITA
jgi:hypothetical protein